MLATTARTTAVIRNRFSCQLFAFRTSTMSTSASDAQGAGDEGPVARSIRTKLSSALQPSELAIVNDSWQHRHHAAMRVQGGGSGETHFSIQVVSEQFRGKTTMQRHRLIYSMLSEELSQGLHALSLKTSTPEEVQPQTASSRV